MNQTKDRRRFFLYSIGLAFVLFSLFSGALWNPLAFLEGLKRIVVFPDFLLVDYVEIGGLSAAFFNAGVLMILFTWITSLLNLQVTGLMIASVFTVGGFALFGKNLFNVWPILIGVYLYSLYKKEPFSRYIYISYFGTAISPLVTQIAFHFPFTGFKAILFSYFVGIVVGFFLPSLAMHFLTAHKGYNLYNVGFTCGMVGMIFAAFFRVYRYEMLPQRFWSSGNNLVLSIFLFCVFGAQVFLGWWLSSKTFRKYSKLLRHSGKLATDFVLLEGFETTLTNMGILGILSVVYVLLVRSQLNGPTIGGIMTVVGFGAFGKHIKNVLPILIGVTLCGLTNAYALGEPNNVLAALFGTTLAPIAGEFGFLWGVIAGFVHRAVVNSSAFMHGGLNLYNNGFAGGLVAMILVPIILALKKGENNNG
ncbi:DUF1576 domain-containing protein [Pseudothermotoga thermarum]|uniref:DUF1576 domain-containing protein n=1 Tax=Pseudothermotoga thermarum DSM 5069 TaxID=688269 RepID=F7YWG3_9THEM|nr:DUF1576 domain-containing protein [Pseudothermotoga thermarum]AEH51942.1 protein of unknown function DUF1576 [Pseudothermotoga thermarum DSM 5069]